MTDAPWLRLVFFQLTAKCSEPASLRQAPKATALPAKTPGVSSEIALGVAIARPLCKRVVNQMLNAQPPFDVLVQNEIAKYAQTFVEFPPMQAGASFNLSALKAELDKKMEAAKGGPGN